MKKAFRHLAIMALAFMHNNPTTSKKLSEGVSYNGALKGTKYAYLNFGESPIYFPTRSQKIKAKRRNARK
ncbi:MAG: hypothetical protein GY739_15990 [Mesoflavibacter sp.]|nr:hypothetical protein [Mesoflavibacter sp.]